MSERLSQIQNLFPQIPTFLFVFFVVVVGFIALMFVLVFLRILWSITRLIFGSRSRRYSLENSGGNSVWRYSMGNPMPPNSPLNPNNPMNPNSPNNPNGWTNMNSPNNPNGWTNMNSPNNPFGWRHPASPNNPHNQMHTPMHRPMHKR